MCNSAPIDINNGDPCFCKPIVLVGNVYIRCIKQTALPNPLHRPLAFQAERNTIPVTTQQHHLSLILTERHPPAMDSFTSFDQLAFMDEDQTILSISAALVASGDSSQSGGDPVLVNLDLPIDSYGGMCVIS